MEKVNMGQICTLVADYVANGSFASLHQNVKYLDSGYARLIRLVDYHNNFDPSNAVYISKESYDFLSKSKIYGGEIIISNVGENFGETFLAPYLDCPMSLAPNAIMIKTNQIDKYIYYYFTSQIGFASLRLLAGGSAVPKFNKTEFKKLEISIHNLDEQQHIVDTIGSIDNLIEKNNKIIEKTKYLSTLIYYQYKEKSVVVSTQSFLKDSCPIHTGKLDANAAKENGSYAFFTCSNDYSLIDEYAYDGKSIIVAGNGVINVRYYDGKFNAYQRVYVLQPKQNLFLYLKEIESNLQSLLRGANGSVIKFITKGMLEEINIPINDNAETINNKIGRLYDYISKLENENVILNKIKKILLHKYFD